MHVIEFDSNSIFSSNSDLIVNVAVSILVIFELNSGFGWPFDSDSQVARARFARIDLKNR